MQYEASGPKSVEEKQEQSQVIGLMDVYHVSEIGYKFLSEHWGKGYATEALKAWMA